MRPSSAKASAWNGGSRRSITNPSWPKLWSTVPSGSSRATAPACGQTSPISRILPSGWTTSESAAAVEARASRMSSTAAAAPSPPQRLPILFTIITVNSPLAAQLRLHRPRRDPAGAGQLALPRRRGRLQPGAGAGAGGLPPGRGRGGDHVRAAGAAGARGGAADGPDLLHLRGRLRLCDRGGDDADDRRDGAERGRDDLRAD